MIFRRICAFGDDYWLLYSYIYIYIIIIYNIHVFNYHTCVCVCVFTSELKMDETCMRERLYIKNYHYEKFPNHRLRCDSTGSHPRITVIASSTVPAQPVQ